MEEGKSRGRFLDLSEYVLKEFSPLTRPISSDTKHLERVISFHEPKVLTLIYFQTHNIQNPQLQRNTPEIAPIDHDPSTLKITPFLNGLISIADQTLEEFHLDSHELAHQDPRLRDRAKPDWASRRRANSLVLMHLDQELEDIAEESDHYFRSVEESASEEQDSEDSISDHQSQKLTEVNLARMRTQSEYRARIQKYVRQPQHTLVKQIRRIQNTLSLSQQSRLVQIKQLLLGYLIEFEIPCFEEAWDQILPFPERVDLICKGVQQSLARKIGELTFEGRRVKLLKYLQKKKMRRWRKKVGYDCRKKVADGRLRIKGKFVTREQVCEQLGIKDIEVYTGDEIKQLLERKREQKSISQ